MKDLWRMDNERGYWISSEREGFCVIPFGHSSIIHNAVQSSEP